MKLSLNFSAKKPDHPELLLISAYCKKNGKEPIINHWQKKYREHFSKVKSAKHFKGTLGETFFYNLCDGTTVLVLGLGEKDKFSYEKLRREMANIFKLISKTNSEMQIELDEFIINSNVEKTVHAITEGLCLTDYEFDRHKSKKRKIILKKVILSSKQNQTITKKSNQLMKLAELTCKSINIGRDLINESPNFLNSETFAKIVEKDAKTLKRVRVKTLTKAQIQKEKMGLFLAVNAGSKYDPRLVHLTYTPAKTNSKTKHVALVGKGLTFDTGGYSLKPSASMVNMKFDMAGAATVYAAFRAAVEANANIKISCLLGMTDNAVSNDAIMPDSIVKARNGKTVEILNTDAEGRLVLADVLDYACTQKPDVIIDCATLTGAVLVALGSEICGLMGNNDDLNKKLIESSNAVDEYMWELPIIDEFRDEMKSPVADLKNTGSSRFGGSAKAAAFLENFISNDIPWAHLDIAGIGDNQSHLPYCPKKGASGLVVRTLTHFLTNA